MNGVIGRFGGSVGLSIRLQSEFLVKKDKKNKLIISLIRKKNKQTKILKVIVHSSNARHAHMNGFVL